MKRLGNSSVLDSAPVHLGRQVAHGIPFHEQGNESIQSPCSKQKADHVDLQSPDDPSTVDEFRMEAAKEIEGIKDRSPDSGIVVVD